MIPKVGEVFMLDLGYQGKTRPIVVVSREDAAAPRALSVFVPLTKESRGGQKRGRFLLLTTLALVGCGVARSRVWPFQGGGTCRAARFCDKGCDQDLDQVP